MNRRSAKRILRAIVEPVTVLAIVGQSQVLRRRVVELEFVRDANMRVTMPRHGFPQKCQSSFAIPGLQDVDFQHLAFVIDGLSEIMCDAVDLNEDLIQMPPPVGQGAHLVDPFWPDLRGEHRAKPVPPEPHGLRADVDPSRVQEVLDVAQR